MKIKSGLWIVLAGAIAGGTYYWFQYHMDSKVFQNFLMALGLLVFFSSVLVKVYLKASSLTIIGLLPCGVILAFMLRILYDSNFLNISHNLFPFEIIISLIPTIPEVLLGVSLGKLFLYFKKE